MSYRAFDNIYHRDRRQFVVVKCGKCGITAEKKKPFMRLSLDETDRMMCQQLTRQFERDGWNIGSRAKDDRCPACVQAVANKPKLTVVKEANHMTSVTAMPAAEPRQMSREDGRVIFAKLEEVYRDERHGYHSGWTDEKVSVDLGVPRAWVAEVRGKFFGAEQTNPEITALIAEAKAYMTEARPLLAKIEQTRTALGSLMAEAQKLGTRGEMIEKRLAAIEKAIRP